MTEPASTPCCPAWVTASRSRQRRNRLGGIRGPAAVPGRLLPQRQKASGLSCRSGTHGRSHLDIPGMQPTMENHSCGSYPRRPGRPGRAATRRRFRHRRRRRPIRRPEGLSSTPSACPPPASRTRNGSSAAPSAATAVTTGWSSQQAARSPWGTGPARTCEIFRLLADAAGAPAGQHRPTGDLMRTVGPGANGMITSSHRLLARLHAKGRRRRGAGDGGPPQGPALHGRLARR
jgi:hypothetical protein